MTPYGDTTRTSGIAAYEIIHDGIIVRFTTGATYTYTVASAGRSSIQTMQLLAKSGSGLNGFINTSVRSGYESRSK